MAFNGKITALDSVINEQTRNIQIQATVQIRAGNCVPACLYKSNCRWASRAMLSLCPHRPSTMRPMAIPYYVVTDMKDPKTGKTYRGVRQQIVKIEGSRGDQVAIISGLNNGDEIVSAGVFRLRNAAPVLINNIVKPSNSPKPHPEES